MSHFVTSSLRPFTSRTFLSRVINYSTTTTDYVKIVEVGPRDGLQNEKTVIPTQKKIELINKLSDCGLSSIEATSFVSAEAIPQLSDSEEVFRRISKIAGVSYPVLVPTLKHLSKAIECGVNEVAVFTAASETFNQKNIRCSINTSLERIKSVVDVALKNKLKVRGYISCVVGCPYEGDIDSRKVVELCDTLLRMGCYEISLGDTIGVGTPGSISKLLREVSRAAEPAQLAIHCHDTYGQALANILRALDAGIRVVDSSIAGLGGCPYAPGASGNVATEDVLYMLNGLGLRTNVNFDKIIDTSRWLSFEVLKRLPRSKVALATYGKLATPDLQC